MPYADTCSCKKQFELAHMYPPALLNLIFASGKYVAWVVACRCASPDAPGDMQACTHKDNAVHL